MLKVSKLNPKDTVLDEIHQIQEISYEEQKDWSFEKLRSYYDELVKRVSSELKVSFKTHSISQKNS